MKKDFLEKEKQLEETRQLFLISQTENKKNKYVKEENSKKLFSYDHTHFVKKVQTLFVETKQLLGSDKNSMITQKLKKVTETFQNAEISSKKNVN